MFILSIGETPIQQITLLENVLDISVQKESKSPRLKRVMNVDEDYFWAVASIEEGINAIDYQTIIDKISAINGVQIVSPFFKSSDSEKLGLSNYFYVQLKEIADTVILESFADRNKVLIVEQNEFLPLWFVMSCIPESGKNAMELANIFKESGLFVCAEPDLMVENSLTCANDTYYSYQWGLNNTGQNNGTSDIDINACYAWSIATGYNINKNSRY